MSNNYSVGIETISPAKAKALLEQFPRNRRSAPERVDCYAKIINRGNWAPFSTIIIDEDGNTIDGHHRLEAIVKSEKSVQMVVFRGLEKKYIPFIDTGRPRTAGDMLAFVEELEGLSSLRNIAAMTRSILYYDKSDNCCIIPPDELATFIVDNKELVQKAYGYYSRIKPIGGNLSHGAALFVVTRENQSNIEAVESFVEKISLGENICSGMPEYAARNAIFAKHGKSHGGAIWRESFYTIFRAWNALNMNEHITHMKVTGATFEAIMKMKIKFN